MSMVLDLTSVGAPGHRRDRGCASRHADSIVPKRDGCTWWGARNAKTAKFCPEVSDGSTDGKSATVYRPLFTRLRSSRICSRCNRIWSQNFWVYWEMFSGHMLLRQSRYSQVNLGLATQTATVSASSVPLPVPAGSSQNYVPDDHYFHPPRAKASCVSTYL